MDGSLYIRFGQLFSLDSKTHVLKRQYAIVKWEQGFHSKLPRGKEKNEDTYPPLN